MKSPELKDRLEESEKLIQEMTVTWEEKLRKTEEVAQVGASWWKWETSGRSLQWDQLMVFLVPCLIFSFEDGKSSTINNLQDKIRHN